MKMLWIWIPEITMFLLLCPTKSTAGITDMIDLQSLSAMTSQISQITSWITSAMTPASGKRGNDRYRHNYYINPVMKRNISTRKRHIPVLFDMAPNSYPVEFMLYTKNNKMWQETLSVANASGSKMFDKKRETKFIIHDYNQSSSDPMLLRLRNAYLSKNNNDYNIIITDWEQARMYSYTVAATVAEYVGVMVARFAIELDADPSRIHVIGFGLGAHAAGVMGHDLNSRIRRITGLDPSMPLFRMSDDTQKLDAADASFVDVIHTDGGDNFMYATHLGMGHAMGHSDIYVQGGIFQPGCPAPVLPSYEAMYCSHVRSLELFIESVENKETIIGCSCDSYTYFKLGKCDCMHRMIYIGESIPQKARGKFFLLTKSKRPYGMGRRGALPE